MKALLTSCFVGAAVLGLSVVAPGCDEAEKTFDCASICKAYSDCVDDDIDVLDCTDSCKDRADDDQDFADRAGQCEDCIDNGACLENAFQCADVCAGIVTSE